MRKVNANTVLTGFVILLFYIHPIDKGVDYQFKVVHSEPKMKTDFYADNVQTTLVQTELDIKDKWIWPDDQSRFEIVSEYTSEMERIINFYSSHHEYSETLPMLLLYGPSGSGKLRSVEALAAKLSMHLCKVGDNYKKNQSTEHSGRLGIKHFGLVVT